MSPYLFALAIDEVTRDIQGDIPWCMFFADDVVLVDERRERSKYKVRVMPSDPRVKVLELAGPKLSI